MRVNVEVTYADTGKFAVCTQRFFRKIDVDTVYAIASLPASELLPNVLQAATWVHDGRGVRLVVLPHGANMPAGWEGLEASRQLELAEPFPSAGRSSGACLSELRSAARDSNLWIISGIVLRSSSSKELLRGVALIGADGWLHAVHTDASPAEGSKCAAGTGDWPATQRARPFGVCDTELGRIAILPDPPSDECIHTLARMGAELVVAPPPSGTPSSRVAVALDSNGVHANYTGYDVCGPEPRPAEPLAGRTWQPTVVAVAGPSNKVLGRRMTVPCDAAPASKDEAGNGYSR